MHIGVFIFATDTTLQPVPLGRAVEERGLSNHPVGRSGGRSAAP